MGGTPKIPKIINRNHRIVHSFNFKQSSNKILESVGLFGAKAAQMTLKEASQLTIILLLKKHWQAAITSYAWTAKHWGRYLDFCKIIAEIFKKLNL